MILRSRLMTEYGMLSVLVLIIIAFSLVTIKNQPIEGSYAGKQLANKVVSQSPNGGNYVLIVTQSGEDQKLKAAFQSGLPNSITQHLRIVDQASPLHAKQVLHTLTQQPDWKIDLIVCSRTTAAWTFYSHMTSLQSTPIISPQQEKRSNFLKSRNLQTLPLKMVRMAVIAIGMTMIIITAGIDLSVGSLVGLSAVTSTLLIKNYGGGTNAGYLMVLLCFAGGIIFCGLMGFTSGILTTFFKVPAFIATLAMMMIARGLAQNLSHNNIITGMPEVVFENLLNLKIDLGVTSIELATPIVLMAVLYLAAHVVMSHTILGRYIYAIGGNREAARLSGVAVGQVLLIVYTITGLMAGIAGVIMAIEFRSGKGIWGQTLELDVIAAVVVGGTSLMGGQGRVLGTLIGCAIIVVIKNGMNLLSLHENTQNIVMGLVILAAIVIDKIKSSEIKWENWNTLFPA